MKLSEQNTRAPHQSKVLRSERALSLYSLHQGTVLTRPEPGYRALPALSPGTVLYPLCARVLCSTRSVPGYRALPALCPDTRSVPGYRAPPVLSPGTVLYPL